MAIYTTESIVGRISQVATCDVQGCFDAVSDVGQTIIIVAGFTGLVILPPYRAANEATQYDEVKIMPEPVK